MATLPSAMPSAKCKPKKLNNQKFPLVRVRVRDSARFTLHASQFTEETMRYSLELFSSLQRRCFEPPRLLV